MLAIFRGVVAAGIILVVGQIPLGLFLTINLKWSPSIPWLLPVTAGTLWLLFRYLNGYGWPASNAERRRHLLRGRELPARIWVWSLIAGAIGMTSAMCLAFIATRIVRVSQRSLDAPFDLSNLPMLTILAVVGAVSLTAGVVEEVAFRGYLISLIEERHGWIVAFLLSSILFFAAHLSHGYASPAFVPFFFAHCAVLTLLVYFTRSILPAIVVHAVSDFIVLPIQYGLIGQRLPMSAAPYVVVAILSAFAAVPAYRQLARAVRMSSTYPAASGRD